MRKFKEEYKKQKKWNSLISKTEKSRPIFDEKNQRVIWGFGRKNNKA